VPSYTTALSPASLIPRPTLSFPFRFALTIIHGSERVAKNRENSSRKQHLVDIREGGANHKFKYSQTELSTASRVSASSEALKTIQLDNELIKDWSNQVCPHVHLASTYVIHVMNSLRPHSFSLLFRLHIPLIIVNAN